MTIPDGKHFYKYKIMKLFNKNILAKVVLLSLIFVFSACQEAQEDFAHDNNLISDLRIKMNTAAQGIAGVIYEYDANGQLVPYEMVTVKAVEGGYGRIVFELDPALRSTYNPERCFLSASLTFDEVISPGLAGLKNITNRDENGVAQGIDIIVTSGIGTTRRYNIVGYFEGEYKLTQE